MYYCESCEQQRLFSVHAQQCSRSDCLGRCRYVFKKQEPGSEKAAKRQRSSSIPDDSPEGKRTRAGDGDALLKSVAQLEQSNQVNHGQPLCDTLVFLYRFFSGAGCMPTLLVIATMLSLQGDINLGRQLATVGFALFLHCFLFACGHASDLDGFALVTVCRPAED